MLAHLCSLCLWLMTAENIQYEITCEDPQKTISETLARDDILARCPPTHHCPENRGQGEPRLQHRMHDTGRPNRLCSHDTGKQDWASSR